jgi:glycosyltransferase involved in cell wall biosynthesis
MMPRVTVIIPAYNAGPYLADCLDSLLGQTLADIEVICVDDGSTDDSLATMKSYAQADSRVKVLHQENAGAGAARNAGLAVAEGEYLSFVDADDFFEPTMLEDVYGRCTTDDADVCLFKARYFETDSGRSIPADGLVRVELLPPSMPFSRDDMPDDILAFASPAPWNKLFKRAFVEDEGLRFQEIKRANDLLFTKLATAKARRITFVDKYLVNYRTGTESSLQATNHETPLEFYDALLALRDGLVEAGLFEQVERGYVNTALSTCLYNLHSLKTPDTFDTLYRMLRDEFFGSLGIDARTEGYIESERHHAQYTRIMELPPEQYVLDEMRVLRSELRESRDRLRSTRARLRKTRARLDAVRGSLIYRSLRAITAIPRGIWRLVRSDRKAE